MLKALDDLPELYKGPNPIAEKEQQIRDLLSTSVMAGVTPNWLSHGLPVLRNVQNKGQA